MELHWPLILFTSLVAASAGLFATQGVYALAGKGGKAQYPALLASVVLLAVGGIAVFFHLQHWERIFNGFGHLSSGITQELIAVVVMAVSMVIFFVMLRREDSVPKWCGAIAIVVSAALIVVMGLSYMMASRPAWDNVLQIFSLLGCAVAAGTGIFAFFDNAEADDASPHGTYAIAGSIVNAVCTIAFVLIMANASSQFVDVGYYFDPNHPTLAVTTAAEYSPFSAAALPFTAGAVVLALASVGFALYGKKSGKWTIAGLGVAICAIVGAILLRTVFFACGGSVFMFY